MHYKPVMSGPESFLILNCLTECAILGVSATMIDVPLSFLKTLKKKAAFITFSHSQDLKEVTGTISTTAKSDIVNFTRN